MQWVEDRGEKGRQYHKNTKGRTGQTQRGRRGFWIASELLCFFLLLRFLW